MPGPALPSPVTQCILAENVSENSQLVKVAAAGAGGCAHDLRNSGLFDKDADDALLGMEGPDDAEERGRLDKDDVPRWRTGKRS